MRQLTQKDVFIIKVNNIKLEKEDKFLRENAPIFANPFYTQWMQKHFQNCRRLSKYQGLGSVCWSRMMVKT